MFKKDAGTQSTRVIMHIVTFFLFLQEGRSLFVFASLVFSLCFFLYFYHGPKRERGKDGFRQRGSRNFVIGLVDPDGIGGAW